MRTILVPVADRPECARALRTAFDLGNQLNASVTGCHIRPHARSRVSLPAQLIPDGSDAAWESAISGKSSKKMSAAARRMFGKVAEAHDYNLVRRLSSNPGAIWQEKVGSPDKIMAISGPVSDLIVVSRPASKSGKVARIIQMAALMDSSRPVLLLPQSNKAAVGKRISIAWNQSAEAARAVTLSIPLLQAAEDVKIISCGPETELGPKSTQLANYLRCYGVKAKRIGIRGSGDGQKLLDAYREAGSDLLVMGAYSRSRLRQRVFGGVTEFMLSKANIPTIMLHG